MTFGNKQHLLKNDLSVVKDRLDIGAYYLIMGRLRQDNCMLAGYWPQQDINIT